MNDYEIARRVFKRLKEWPEPIDTAEDLLRDCGVYPLGSGAYGIVIDCDTAVVKFFGANDYAYLAFLDLAISHPSNYLPEIYWVRRVNKHVMSVCMEKLERMEFDRWDYVLPEDYELFKKMLRKSDVEGDEEMVETADLLHFHREGVNEMGFYLCEDLHTDNVMRRGEQLVITDPWCI